MTWRPEIVSRLQELIERKLTIGQIAIAMHMSRNQVAGAMFRLGLKSQSGKDHGLRKGAKYKTVRQQELVLICPQPVLEVVQTAITTFSDKKDRYGEKGCQWPLGDPKDEDFRFCLSTRVHSKPYCGFHCQQAYQKKPVGGQFVIFSKQRNPNLVGAE